MQKHYSVIALTTLIAILFCVNFNQAIRFEAEKGHVVLMENPIGLQNDYTEKTVDLSSIGDRIIFDVNIPKDGQYPVSIHYTSKGQGDIHLLIRANGHDLETPILSQTSNVYKTALLLRYGINTIIIQKHFNTSSSSSSVLSTTSSSIFNMDYMEIPTAIPTSVNGATLPYFEIEAENARLSAGARIIGPSYAYTTLPSEASGRRAVQITGSQTITFTLPQSAQALVVRYSIPDNSNGNGNYANLGVFISSRQVLTLPVNSHFSWIYGSYPFTKNPSDGTPHHFYDEVRAMFPGTVPAGTQIVLQGLTNGITYTIDLIDFYNVVPNPYPQPNNFLSITQFGADPSGNRDSTNAIQQTINAAVSQKKSGVFIPIGNFTVNSRFTVDSGIIIRGAGPWHSSVIATVVHGVGFFGNFAPNPSNNIEFYDFAMFGDTNVRVDSAIDSGCGGAINNGIIQNLWITHTKCGMWFDGAFSGTHITGIKIANTFADGINLHKSISNVMITQCMIRNTGDDGLAIWSDASGSSSPDQNNNFNFNTIQIPVLANCIAIYGGTSNNANDNYVADSIYAGGGLQTSQRFTSTPFSGSSILARNVLVRSGAPNQVDQNGAIWIWPQQGAMTNGVIKYENIQINDSPFEAITFWGGQESNVYFDDVKINNATYAIFVNSAGGQAYFTNVVATNLRKGGVQSCDGGFKLVKVSGNSGWDDVHCN